ncbi:unnamed protein product [Symbiodinium sp. CCMP2592]|nr:unnamed protein product [Symbiodinium sp. CCMP2592]CAE7425725.1 unnamed protein product [Symbiodinium sp. CCMP2592]
MPSPQWRILLPGTTIALHSQIHNRFAQMHSGNMGQSAEKGAMEIPDGWSWERFTVVDAGHGQIASRFATTKASGVGAASPHRSVDQLGWASEKWEVRPAGNGQIVLYNRPQPDASNIFECQITRWTPVATRIHITCQTDLGTCPGGPCEAISSAGYHGAPQALLLEKENHTFSHTQNGTLFWGGVGGFGGMFGGGISSFDPFGAIKRAAEEEARRQQEEAEERARQLALRGTIGRNPPRRVENFPDSWTYEHFTVLDAANGQVAFHNSFHNRYLKMDGGWTWERFQIVPVRPYLQPGTLVALHCGIHNSYVSMNGAELQRSEVRNHNDLPSNWVWERFTVVDAGNFRQWSSRLPQRCPQPLQFK